MKEKPEYCTWCKKQVFKNVNHWEDIYGNRTHIRCQKEREKEKSTSKKGE